MRRNEIKVGGLYEAKVSNVLTVVRVDRVNQGQYHVTNLRTKRTTVFRSAAKFRCAVQAQPCPKCKAWIPQGDKPRLLCVRCEVENKTPKKAIAIESKNWESDDPCPYCGADGCGPLEPTKVLSGNILIGCSECEREWVSCVYEDSEKTEQQLRYDPLGRLIAAANLTLSSDEIDENVHPERVADRLRLEERALHTPTEFNAEGTILNGQTRLAAVQRIEEAKGRKVGRSSSPLASALREKTAMKAEIKGTPHIIVKALAGSGKTFSLVVGVVYTFRNRVKGLWERLIKELGFEPEPTKQQQAIWDVMASSEKANTVQFTAFNNSIVSDFESKWSWVIQELGRAGIQFQFATNHSMGFAAVRRAFPGVNLHKWRVSDIIGELLNVDIREVRREKPVVITATEKLVEMVKANLTDTDPQTLDQLASYYDIDLCDEGPKGICHRDEVFALVPRVIERCKDVRRDMKIDFNDMIWLPVVLDLPVFKHDLLLVDEFQDTNKARQQLVMKAGRRLILCGDTHQCIYGFSGADVAALRNIEEELLRSPQGCVLLPLTFTRRCGKAIVREAQPIVPDFDAFPENCEGKVSHAKYPIPPKSSNYWTSGNRQELPYEETYMPLVKDGDLILCRCNAPLVSQCFRFLKRGRKAWIQGRDVGAGLLATIKKLNADNVPDLITKLMAWADRETQQENAKKNPSDTKLILIEDRVECILCFVEGASTLEEVEAKIKKVFGGKDCPKCKEAYDQEKQCPKCKGPLVPRGGIKFSSVHKAKGQESKRVFILQVDGASMPHPMAKKAWEMEQEMNIKYVAVTRSIEELIWVS